MINKDFTSLNAKFADKDILEELRWCMNADFCGYLTRSDAEYLTWLCGKAYEEIKQL